ncbi:hypothetical protein VP501E541_P0206 [Vibrio phage 501E54-1]|nr:hypothetical protein VP501E541_P0206 [Vibrio phage 501E54-1]
MFYNHYLMHSNELPRTVSYKVFLKGISITSSLPIHIF